MTLQRFPFGLRGVVPILLLASAGLFGCAGDSYSRAGAGAGDESRAETAVSPDVIAASPGPIRLQGAASRFALTPAPGGRDPRAALAGLPAEGKVFLVLRDLSAEEPPGVLFHLYLGLPEGEEPGADDPRYCGSFNFFDAVPSKPGFYSFDVSGAVASLRAEGRLEDSLTVAVVPGGDVAAGTAPAIARAELVLR